jgi:hypothetical protein
LPPILISLAAVAVLGWAPLERTLFKDIPSNDPVREIVQTVLGSRFFCMRDGFPGREWTEGGYGAAWERVREYFPGKTYYVVPGTFFMTHGFDADGRLFMEIHESAYLKLCVGNGQTFTPGSIVGAYGRMLEPTAGPEAAAFREKLGRLEPFFRDEDAHRGLRKAMGEDLYLGLLKSLAEEDYHMIAGGFMHEGMHAGLDDALVARLQAEFSAGTRPVQWDELRAFMAEIGYHGPYDRWAAGDIAGHWRRVENLLGELEGLRKKPSLRPGSDRRKFERVRAQAWTHAALIRLRTREIWQSARRMQDLSTSFQKDYIRNAPSAEIGERLAGLERDTAGFVTAAGEAAQATELAVRSLEAVLDTWGEWAEGRRPFPPPVTDSQAAVKQVKGILWPEPAVDAAATLMKKAAEALEKERPPA